MRGYKLDTDETLRVVIKKVQGKFFFDRYNWDGDFVERNEIRTDTRGAIKQTLNELFDEMLLDPEAYRRKNGRWASPDGTVPPVVTKKARAAKAGK